MGRRTCLGATHANVRRVKLKKGSKNRNCRFRGPFALARDGMCSGRHMSCKGTGDATATQHGRHGLALRLAPHSRGARLKPRSVPETPQDRAGFVTPSPATVVDQTSPSRT